MRDKYKQRVQLALMMVGMPSGAVITVAGAFLAGWWGALAGLAWVGAFGALAGSRSLKTAEELEQERRIALSSALREEQS
jgi:hypothetical protein